jgi:catechol 2,3-dioxygenase-like lactoylglutathione lyase family enzyme
MSVKRLDNVAIVVSDLESAIGFFEELGLVLEGRASVEGDFVDGCVGLSGVRTHIAMVCTPDGKGRLELTQYEKPSPVAIEPLAPNSLGFTRVMFAVDDIDDTVARLEARGASLLDRIVQYEDAYRLCYLRGPDGIIVALAQEL